MPIIGYTRASGLSGFQGNSTEPVSKRGYIRLPEGLNLKGKFLMAANINCPCIFVYPASLHEEIYPYIVSPPEKLVADKYGKVELSKFLLSSAQLEPGASRATLAGVGKHFEIWLKENWDKYIRLCVEKADRGDEPDLTF